MSTITRCDGCQRQLCERDDHVRVERQDPSGIMRIPGLPDNGDPLHWCTACAIIAVAALDGSGS